MTTRVCTGAELLTAEIWGAGGGGKREGEDGDTEEEEGEEWGTLSEDEVVRCSDEVRSKEVNVLEAAVTHFHFFEKVQTTFLPPKKEGSHCCLIM